MEISCRVCRPRKPRESPLFQLVERDLDEMQRVWPERFARQRGPLRAVVERVLREFLRCGLLEHGFARVWCGQCRRSVLVAFSCRGRSFCPSCEKKRQLLWAEWLCEEVLAKVAPASSSRSPPPEIWFSGIRTSTCSRPTAAGRRTAPGSPCRNGTVYGW